MTQLRLVQTCGACPEQYDVFRGEELVGYMRLRHGFFYVSCRGEQVHASYPRGDGIFADEADREVHLNAGCQAILLALAREDDARAPKLYTVEQQ